MHEQYLSELTELRDKLKAKLSAGGQESGKESGPTAADLAQTIKAIKAVNSIEATPQRARQKHMAAEEPITARIRRRQEEAASSSEAELRSSTPSEPEAVTFQERILRERLSTVGEGQTPG